jgi:hypothetical protein
MKENIWINYGRFVCIDNRYTAGFHSNSYIKYLPLQSLENTGRFKMEIWFLSESSSGWNSLFVFLFIKFLISLGLLIYSEHMNSKKGNIKLYIQRKMIIFNVIIGSKSISLRYFIRFF